MRYCVTGSSGFIGSRLVVALKTSGHEVVEFDLKTGSDIREWRDCLRVRGCDVVLHQAAISSVEECEQDPARAHETNVTGFLNILLACKEHGVGRLVYASSAAVHGDTVYGATKRACEAYGSLFPAVGLRYFNVYGGGNGVVDKWARLMHAGKPVEIYGDGEQRRDFVHISDVLKANLDERPPGVYEIGTGKSASLNQLFRCLAREYGYKQMPVYLPARPNDIRESQAEAG